MMSKPKGGVQTAKDRKALVDWLMARGMSAADANRLVRAGQTRGECADALATHCQALRKVA